MSQSNRTLAAAIAVLLICTFMAACDGRGVVAAESGEAVALRSYKVPDEYQEEIRGMLRYAMGPDEAPIGRVTKGPGGTILVVAPPGIHAGVERILDELQDTDVPPPPAPIALSYWLLVGRPIEPSRTTEAFSVAGGRKLKQIEPVLAQIAKAEGPTEFMLLERIRLTSMSQERAESGGQSARVHQRATRTAGKVVADVQISLNQNRFQSQVMLAPQQFLVLGQAGYADRPGNAFPDAANGAELTLYYVMAADLDS